MTTKFPADAQLLIDQAICNLWDKKYPKPDLEPLGAWLESDGWDYVVDGIFSPYFHIEKVKDYFSDESLIDYGYAVATSEITDKLRIEFARHKIDYLLSESMDSVHIIEIESMDMPPAVLCILMYYHGQGGAFFDFIGVDFSAEDFVNSIKNEIILDHEFLTDSKILEFWLK